MRSLLTLVLVAISMIQFYLPAARADKWESQSQLHLVRRIYVGSMGESDEAERFRLLLEEELSAKGFTVVHRSEKADAILSGALSVRVHDKKTRARVYVKLETPEG